MNITISESVTQKLPEKVLGESRRVMRKCPRGHPRAAPAKGPARDPRAGVGQEGEACQEGARGAGRAQGGNNPLEGHEGGMRRPHPHDIDHTGHRPQKEVWAKEAVALEGGRCQTVRPMPSLAQAILAISPRTKPQSGYAAGGGSASVLILPAPLQPWTFPPLAVPSQ